MRAMKRDRYRDRTSVHRLGAVAVAFAAGSVGSAPFPAWAQVAAVASGGSPVYNNGYNAASAFPSSPNTVTSALNPASAPGVQFPLAQIGIGNPWGRMTGQPGTFVQPAITGEETYTDNANYGFGGPAQGDWISQIIPALTVQSVTPRLHLTGDMQFDAVDYLHHTQPNRVLPSGGIDGTLEAVRNHLYLDTGVTAVQSPNYLYLPSGVGGSTFNTFTTYDYHISPDFRGDLPAAMQYDLRSSNAWTHSVNAPYGYLTNTYLAHDSAELSKEPQDYGFTLKVEQFDNRFGSVYGDSTRQQIGRLIPLVALDPQILFGLRGGVERENYLPGDPWHSIRGAEFEWRPTVRDDFFAEVEQRFFGNSYRYSLQHRSPWFALSLTGSRDITTMPQELFSLPATGNVAGLLDSMLMTQYPDAAARAQAVQALIAGENLPNSMASPALLFTPLAYLSESNMATAIWIGHRSAVSVSIFESRAQALSGTTLPAVTSSAAFFEGSNIQRGASIDANRHVSRYTSLALTVSASRTEGIGSASGFSMSQSATTLRMIRQISARTDFTVGARNQVFSSPLLQNGREKAVFVALSHRFGSAPQSSPAAGQQGTGVVPPMAAPVLPP